MESASDDSTQSSTTDQYKRILKSGPRMFRKRVIEDQGKIKDYRKKLSKISTTNSSWSPNRCMLAAMREMGYVNTRTERPLYLQWVAERQGKRDLSRDVRKKAAAYDFEEALRTLADQCDTSVALQWIANHPAMSRKARTDGDSLIKLTADDILLAPHGKAPSKFAATSLQVWVNKPEEFYRNILSEQKKSSKEVAEKDLAVEKAYEDIDAILAALQHSETLSGVQPEGPKGS